MKKVILFVLALTISFSPFVALASTQTKAVNGQVISVSSNYPVSDYPVRSRLFIPGDITFDGQVTMGDALMLYDYLAGLIDFNSLQKNAAEVTSDGKINSFDMEAILAYARGDLPKLPIRFGDLNFDDQVNWNDLSLVLAYCQGKMTLDPGAYFVADVYREGFINATDAYLIYAYMRGWVKELPVIPNCSR